MVDHLGLTINIVKGEFRPPTDILNALSKKALALLGRAASNARCLPTRQLASFAKKAQFLYLR
jgi:hypothetical protein